MLSLDAFLARILPSSGDIVVVEMTPTGAIHYAFTSIPQAVAKIRALEQIRANIYIAMAGFKPGSVKLRKGRKQENVEHLRSLWLDLDVGPEADKYPTQRDAAAALKTFIDTTGLPDPLVVGSGGGLHVYWPLDTDIDQPTWKPLALALKALCAKHGLKIDVRCTADAARILRPVETTNWKTGIARPVKVKINSPAYAVSDLRPLLGLNGVNILQRIPHTGINGNSYGLGSIDIADPEQFDGQKILDGCKQMQWAMHNADDVPEPMWREMVGTLYKSNAPHLIHMLSQGHAAYDYTETESKGRLWKGRGATCKSLETQHPGGCIGCPHLGVIKSPSTIGFIDTPAPEIHIDPATAMPQGWFHQDGMLWMHTEEGSTKIYSGTIEVGDPFMDRNNFGISRLLAPMATIVNGSRTEGYVDYAATLSPGELHKALTSCGIVFEPRYHKNAMATIRAWLQDVRSKAAVSPAHRQLGWNSTAIYDHAARYILGETTYQPDGTTVHTRLSENIKPFGKDIHAHGTLQDWQQAYNLLGLPGYEAHMVMSWIAFGAPLTRLDATPPAMVHAYSQNSSQGKTSVLNLINSAYGDPASASMSWSSNATTNSIQTALSVMNGIPMGVDELTRLEPDEQHRLLYECTQQMGRKRLKQDGTLQESVMTKTMLYSTGNTSLQSIASTMQIDDTPLQARLAEIELNLPPMTPQERSTRRILVESVRNNFGHAAPVYVGYVVRNQEKVSRLLATVRQKLEHASGAENIERFQISTFSTMITGALLARKLGLISHPVERGIEWIVDWFAQQRSEQTRASSPLAILERMISDFQLHVLVVTRDQPVLVNITAPKLVDIVKRPPRELFARYAIEEQRLYVHAFKIKHWLVEHQLNVKATLDAWHKTGLLQDLHQSVNRLGGYTEYNVERQRCYIFDVKTLDTLQDVLSP
jgi:hypothetical protein